MRSKWLLLILLTASVAGAQQTPAPVLFFTDLTQGPATGNSDNTFTSNGGVYVTLYGNFLDNFSNVTLNGSACLAVVSNPSSWLWYEKMVVQLKGGCSSGNFAVTTASGTSNGVPFTVASGSIYYVATSGRDGNSGTFSSPWATLPHAVQTAGTGTGNVIYAENGVSDTGDDGQGWGSSLTLRAAWCSGGTPNSLVSYPNATVTVGSTTSGIGIRGTDSSASGGACNGGWTFGGLQIRGQDDAVSFNGPSGYPSGGSSHWRLIANDVTCPHASSQTGCVATIQIGGSGNTNKFFGNNVHDVGNLANQPNTDQQHGMYFGTQSRHFEIGWSEVSNVQACRGIQIYSSPEGMFDFSIHDNTIHDTACDGIDLFALDPSSGPISIYNNVIYLAGKGPQNTQEGGGNFTGIYESRTVGSGNGGSGTMQVYNNTLYKNGTVSNSVYGSCQNFGGVDISNNDDTTKMQIQNNLIFQTGTNPNCPNGIPFWLNGTNDATALFGANNLMWGVNPSQAPPNNSHITGTVNSDPLLVDVNNFDFHLSSSNSPANGAGASSGPVPVYDHDGVIRPSPPSIGAFEYAPGSGNGGPPNPPTGLQAVVH